MNHWQPSETYQTFLLLNLKWSWQKTMRNYWKQKSRARRVLHSCWGRRLSNISSLKTATQSTMIRETMEAFHGLFKICSVFGIIGVSRSGYFSCFCVSSSQLTDGSTVQRKSQWPPEWWIPPKIFKTYIIIDQSCSCYYEEADVMITLSIFSCLIKTTKEYLKYIVLPW